MRVRALDENGDMQFGRGQGDFYVDDRRGVAQNVSTRLGLYVKDWFLDLTAGMPWRTQVLGRRTDATRDPAVRARILGTPGVTAIAGYASRLNRGTRAYDAEITIDTAYGQTVVAAPVSAPNGDVRNSR